MPLSAQPASQDMCPHMAPEDLYPPNLVLPVQTSDAIVLCPFLYLRESEAREPDLHPKISPLQLRHYFQYL